MDIKDYMVRHKNYFSPEFCKDTIKQILERESDFSKHDFYNVTENSHISYDDDFQIYLGHVSNTDVLVNAVRDLSIEYAQKFGMGSLQGFTHPRFNVYTPGTNMKKHFDHIHSIFDGFKKGIPIFSILMALNTDYEGGELVFFDDDVTHMDIGDVLIFPSNFMYPHKVNTVVGSNRYSVVSWVY